MKKKPKLSHYLEFGIYRAVEMGLAPLPISWACRIGRGMGFFAWAILPGYRRLILKNLRIAAGELHDYEKLEDLTLETFKVTGANFMGSLKCASLSSDEVADCLDFEGNEELIETLRSGRGVVLAMGHMGSWEILTRMNAIMLKGFAGAGIYRPLNNPLMDALIHRRRSEDGTVLFSKRESFHLGAKHLKEGGVLGIASDQRVGNAGTLAPFFGRLSSCVPLPQLLHRRSGAAVYSLSMATVGLGKWKICVRPVDQEPLTTTAVMDGLTQAMSLSLPDGFWFHKRWKVDNRPLGLNYKKADPQEGRVSKPIRLLAVLPHGQKEEGLLIVEKLQQLEAKEPPYEVTVLSSQPLTEENLKWIEVNPQESLSDLAKRVEAQDREQPSPYEFVLNLGEDDLARSLGKSLSIPVFSPNKDESLDAFFTRLGA